MRNILGAALLGFATLALTAPASAAVFTYELNGNLGGTNGAPDLSQLGGTLTQTGYAFDANKGLSLDTAFLKGATEFSIQVDFSLTGTGGYRKIIDFSNLVTDAGLYDQDNTLSFYPRGGGGSGGAGEKSFRVSRDANGLVSTFINNDFIFSFDDSDSKLMNLSAPKLYFFVDDFRTGQGEASGGFVNRIVIDAPGVNPSTSDVPGPIAGAGIPALLALGGLAWVGRRKQAAA